jgi:chromatin remodeling complex protein RSC6
LYHSHPITKQGDKMAAKKKSKGKKKSSSRKSSARKSSRKATKKAARKTKRKSSGKKRTPNAAFMKPMQPSSDLASVVGSSPMPRTEVTKKLWQYIKRKGLQDSKNRRMINADENLRPIFGRGQVSMFEMTRLVNKHLKNP